MKQNTSPFKSSRFNWIFAIIVIAISSFIYLRNDGLNEYSLGYLAGSIVVAAIGPLTAAFLVWFIKKRKEFAGSYTFNFVLALLCFGMVKELGALSKEKSKSVSDITKSASDYREKLRSENDEISAYKEHISNVDKELSKLISNSSGNEQKVYLNLQKFLNINSEVMISWENAYDSIMNPRILDYAVLNNQQEIEYQVSVLTYYQEQSRKYKSYATNMISLFQKMNKNIPSDNKTLQGVMKGMIKKDSLQKPVLNPLLDKHIDYSKHLIEMIEFLIANLGKWEYKNQEMLFTDANLEEKYIEITDKIAADEGLINELSDKLIEVI